MAPELFNTLEAQELVSLGKRVREWQEAKQLSTNALIKKFPDLGSDKTYRRICDNDLAELDLGKQLDRYRAVWTLIESLSTTQEKTEELYDDLTPVAQLRRAFVETMRETGNSRVIFMIAPSGAGKTSAQKILCEKYGQRILWIEAGVVWKDNPNAMLGAILARYGVRDLPPSPVGRFDLLVERLCQTRTCLVFDEAHHMGPACLNTVKTLVNQTPGEFVLLALGTLWSRLERSAYEEVRQLSGNRLAEKITISGVLESDLAKIITRRVPSMADDKKLLAAVTRALMDRASAKGNLAFVRDVITRVNELSEGTAGPDLDCWSTAISKELASR